MQAGSRAAQLWRRVNHPHWGAALGAAVSLCLFAAAVVILGKTLSAMDLSGLGAAIAEIRMPQVLAALGFTALSYLALTGYDVAALLQIGARAPYRVTALASFAAYAFSFTLGFPLVTGGAVRMLVYERAQLGAMQVANVTLVAGVTFWFGMIASLGVALILGATPLAELDHLPPLLNFLLGALALFSIAAYAVWATRGKRRFSLRGHAMELPGPRAALAQSALGVLDVCAAAAALYVLLPQGSDIGFSGFLAIYVFACVLGVVSHAPGGVGVFEATMLHALPARSPESLLAALLLFRVVYYFIPFLIACAALGATEGPRRFHNARQAIIRSVEARDWSRLFG